MIESKGPALIAAGYRITPIRQGAKAPILKDWANRPLAPEDCSRYSGCGVGVICGHGIVAIDVDTHNEALAAKWRERFENEEGLAPIRVGARPKFLVVKRLREGSARKIASRVYLDSGTSAYPCTEEHSPVQPAGKNQLEILCDGQQFVAYGVHPGTGRPYEWVDLMGGLEWCPAAELNEISVDELEQLVRDFEADCEALGMVPQQHAPAATAAKREASELSAAVAAEPLADYTLARARDDLGYISAEEYDQWIQVGQALHLQFAGSAEALDAYDDWSSTASTYKGREEVEAKWASFGKHADGRMPVTARTIIRLAADGKRESARMLRKAALDAATASVEAARDSSDLLDVASRTHLADIGDRLIFINQVQRRFKSLAGVSIAKEQLEKMLPRTMAGEYPLTEAGNAQRMVDTYQAGVMFIPQTNQWYRWNGVYWRTCVESQLQDLARQTVEALKKEAEAKNLMVSTEMQKFIARCDTRAMHRGMFDIFRLRPEIQHDASELDVRSDVLALENGVVDLATGRFSPTGNPNDRVTRHTGVRFDAAADCPLWRQTVSEVFGGDEDLVRFFQTAVGYTLMGNPREQVAFVPYGSGANGKSTVIEVVRQLLGEFGCRGMASTFLGLAREAPGAARGDLIAFQGRRMIYVDEPDEGSLLKEATIKAMTGGEPMVARAPYAQAPIEFKMQAVIWMPTNHLPIIRGMDEGIWRRIIPIPFLQKFEGAQRDVNRVVRLTQELSGILNWALEGALRYQSEGLVLPACIAESRQQYRVEMDILAGWIEDCCVVAKEQRASVRALFSSWETYASQTGQRELIKSTVALGRKLKAKGFRDDRWLEGGVRTRGFVGIGLREVSA